MWRSEPRTRRRLGRLQSTISLTVWQKGCVKGGRWTKRMLAAVVSGGGIYLSADGGITWVTRASQQWEQITWKEVNYLVNGA